MKFLILNIFLVSMAYGATSLDIAKWAESYESYLTKNSLYDKIFRNETTKDGRLACARVVQIVLQKAKVKNFNQDIYLVNKIQSLTSSWKTIKRDQILPGDIIFWKLIFTDNVCNGGGDCHVGIAVGNDQSLDNHGLKRRPFISNINRFGWIFLYAKRLL